MELQKHREVQGDIIAALAEVGKKHGLVFESAGGRYGTDKDLFKINATATDTNGQKLDVERDYYIKYATVYGLKPEWLDKTFISPRQGGFTVIGLRSGSRSKYKVATRRFDGQKLYWTVRSVIENFVPVASKTAA